ncbi:MAG: hypothetical protein A3A97_03315 [Candidatus Terrybacteria bacterium RIFCSPLOWO2_01_FULL_40_23]|uniref:FAD/NAD(P)-binding domain-containing protein n=1 Tax=Candidatus Terrybacteria bacterium RIFCSPLOWO2_01_FULL_40_23 TaxID=1802366 RepID=A0A1G2PSI5_9BACT|nr:MAG: hypothetical protein A3A97_03315 [Candidatus Terrybacteria bacterium RIFCSPLOWO2_01_FULL_40_23]
MQYELIIIGGGPGAVAAGVYAARKKIKSLLITDSFGGQSTVSAHIQNWIGIPSIVGLDMADIIEKHLRQYAGDIFEIKTGVLVTKVEKKDGGPALSTSNGFVVTTDENKTYETKAIILASGSGRRKLQVPGAAQFDGKGVVYCATCDAPLFNGKEVAVIGGGNAGLESAEQLLEHATKVYIVNRSEEFRGDPVTRERIFKSPKLVPIVNADIQEVKGDKFVSGLVYKDSKTGEVKEIPVQGIFVEIGSVPNSAMVKDLVQLTPAGDVVIDHKTARTSVEGIWAAGDVTDQPYKQNNISMGDSVKALEDCYLWLRKQ